MRGGALSILYIVEYTEGIYCFQPFFLSNKNIFHFNPIVQNKDKIATPRAVASARAGLSLFSSLSSTTPS